MTWFRNIGPHKRTIKLPSGRRISLRTYVDAWRKLRDMEKHGVDYMLINDWDWFAVEADQVLAEIRRGVDHRINTHMPGYAFGRKWDWRWQRDVRRIADNMRQRIITRERECPPEIRERLKHRLYTDEDLMEAL